MAFACAFTMFAGAAFTDEADIQAKDAVSMLTTLGVIEGYEDGSFQPEGTVTRAEMAKMIFVVRNNTADDAAYANVSTSLTDISGHWAEGYIKFCESQGIIAGKGNGIFDPDATVTGTEAAKMLLVLAGYEPDKAGLEGTNWATNTLKHAGAAGILDKVSSGLESGLPRQWAAQMIYNTLSANRVVWSADSNSFDDVLNGGVKETVGRAYMGLYATVGTLVTVDLDRLVIDAASIDENESDSTASIWNDGKWNLNYEDEFTKVTTDYSDLLGQKVKVMFKDANTSKVLGVFATQENTVYTVTANQTSRDDDKVAFDGASYRIDVENGGIRTYMNGNGPFWTTLDELDSNALNPNMYTFIDSDGNGRLDTLVVKTYDVAQVTYAASDKIIANAVTYKYADENIADGIEKDDWVIITANLFEDKLDIVKADVQTGTLDALRNNRNKDVYFDGGAVALRAANYNEYQIGDNWYNGGEFVADGSAAVRSNRSTNDLNAVKAGDSVDYVAVNGIMFSVKKSTGENVGRVDSAALIVGVDNTNVADRAKIALFDGTTKTVEYNAGDSVSPLVPGTVYEYSVSGSEYTFEPLQDGVADTDYENYYGDLTYMGNRTITAGVINAMEANNTVAASDNTNYTIDDNAQVLLFSEHTDGTSNQVKKLTGKQFKALDLANILGAGTGVTLETPSVAYGFYGSMNGLSRVGALAVQVADDTNLDNVAHRTWSNYAVIVSDAKYIVRNKTIQYDIWTGTETLTVQEDHNRIDDRTANTAIGYDDLTVIGTANAAALIMRAATATHQIEGVDALSAAAGDDLRFTAITKVSNDGKTVQFADGTERDASGATILYIDSDGKVGIADGKTVAANKNAAGRWMANALYSISSGNDIELLIVDQGEYLKSDTYKNNVVGTNTVYGDADALAPGEGDGDEGDEGEQVVNGATAKVDTAINLSGNIVATLTLDRADFMAADASVDVDYEVWVNGVFNEAGNTTVPANASEVRFNTANGGYSNVSTSDIEIKITKAMPAAVNVEFKGLKLSTADGVTNTATLATSGTNSIEFTVATTDTATGKIMYTISGLTTGNVTTPTKADSAGTIKANAKHTLAGLTAAGDSAVVVTLSGDLTETYSVTYADDIDQGIALSDLTVTDGDTADDAATIQIEAGKTTGIAKDEQVKISVTLSAAPTNLYGYKVAVNVNGEAKTFTLTNTTAAEFYTTVTGNVTINKASIVSVTGVEKVGVVADDSNKVAVQVAGFTYRIPFNMELDMTKIATDNVTNDNDTSAATCQAVSFENGYLVVTFDKAVDDSKTIKIAAEKAVSKDDANNKNAAQIVLTLSGDEWTLN